MKKKKLLRIATKIGVASLMLACLALYSLFLRPNILVGKPSKQLHIPRGTSFRSLQATLLQKGYLSNATSFYLLARLMRYDRKVRSGVYQLQPNMSNWAVIRLLRAGIQQPVKMVFHDVKNKAELAHQLTKNLEVSTDAFKQLLDDPDFVRQYGFEPENVLTMFIPNTYEVYCTIDPKKLFERMYREYQRFWNEHRRRQAKNARLTPVEVAILASMVQSETNKVDEAPLIAGVYINRLRKRIALGSDPTLLYILDDPTVRRVLSEHRAVDSPYNTYKYRGLPPGPICLPTIAMIDSVLNFSRHHYLYFSAKEDFSGAHYFTRSFEQHLRNAQRYQRALNRARIYR